MDLLELQKKLRVMERKLLEKYLKEKRPLQQLPRLIAQLTEGQRQKFFQLASFERNSIQELVGLCERTIKHQHEIDRMSKGE